MVHRNPSIADQVAHEVEARRTTAGISLRALESATGIPKSTLNRSLTGHRPLDVQQLEQVAAALGTTVLSIVSGAAGMAVTS